ncbi:hypothetical protein Fcan01_23878 [Folsomia candida]|uniref:Uncharacterized protein n=1 Tax=Folsomia candida TaxID=158441 RepID=A0A226D9S0_FOLCA|nr:hypothetical protein Fcan01_23878 [Folsomia candida]
MEQPGPWSHNIVFPTGRVLANPKPKPDPGTSNPKPQLIPNPKNPKPIYTDLNPKTPIGSGSEYVKSEPKPDPKSFGPDLSDPNPNPKTSGSEIPCPNPDLNPKPEVITRSRGSLPQHMVPGHWSLKNFTGFWSLVPKYFSGPLALMENRTCTQALSTLPDANIVVEASKGAISIFGRCYISSNVLPHVKAYGKVTAKNGDGSFGSFNDDMIHTDATLTLFSVFKKDC